MGIGRPITLTTNIASKSISVTCETEGQTSFTVTGGYRINQLAVFRNGTRLVDGQDFTARDGSTVTLVSGATVSDTLEFQIFDSFNVADAIQSAATTQTIDGALVVTGGITGSQIGIQSAGTAINYTDGTATPFSYIDPEVTVGEDLMLDDTTAGTSDTYVVSIIPQINIASGIAVTVGSGKTMIIDVLQIGDL